jgi:short-subunit dehydrogenase
MASRDLTRGTTAASTLQEQGLSVEHITVDVTNDESIAAAEKLVDEKCGHIDVLINNAGTFTELALPRLWVDPPVRHGKTASIQMFLVLLL